MADRRTTKRKPAAHHDGKLSAKQKLFLDIYLGRVRAHVGCRFRAAASYLAAGYQCRNNSLAANAACHLLAKPHAQEYIARIMAERSRQASRTEQEVAAEMEALGFSDITEVCGWDEAGQVVFTPSDRLPGHVRAAVRTIKQKREIKHTSDGQIETINTEISMHDKRQALQDYGRHQHGMWPNRIDIHHKADPAEVLDRGADEARERAEKKRSRLAEAQRKGLSVVAGRADDHGTSAAGAGEGG